MLGAYFLIKLSFFFGIVRALVKSDELAKHFLFLAVLYTAGVAFLSYVFISGWQQVSYAAWQRQLGAAVGVSPRLCWLAETLMLSAVYFKLLGRFDEGAAFWFLLLLGVPIVLF